MSNKTRLGRDVILNVAVLLAEEVGLENVTLSLLAEKLEVKSPSLYNHLEGLKELQAGMAALSIRRLETAVRDAAVGKSKAEALMGIALAYRKFATENPELYKTILKYPVIEDDEVREAGLSIVRVINQVMEPYHYQEEDIIHFVRGFRSAVHGFVSLEEAGFFQATFDADESYRRLVASLISTLATQGAA
jgi:AcrR family transcriptional regulator